MIFIKLSDSAWAEGCLPEMNSVICISTLLKGAFNMANEQLIKALHDCMAACNHCFDACLNEDDVNMMANCIRLDRECSEICGYLEGALSRNSPVVQELAEACAKICDACADECSQHDHDHCQKCADACAKCAEACHQVA